MPWKPFLIDPEIECANLRKEYYQKSKSTHVYFKTYRELLKALPEYIKKSWNNRCLVYSDNPVPHNEVTVFRSRRGEWGEWFEKWALHNGKLKKTKEGWM